MKIKNGLELYIEKAEKEDAKQILDYLNIVGGESDNLLFGLNGFTMSVEAEENYIMDIHSSKSSALFVGKIDNEIVCVGSLSSPVRARIAHQGEIAISAKMEFWNLGIGTYLLKKIIDFARHTNTIEILHLGVKSDNINAIELYKRSGFEEIGLYKKFFKINGQYFDEILMNLYL